MNPIDFDRSQIMRGTLEGCILGIISKKTTYGYEIVGILDDFGFQDISEGTIYPLLVRLEKKALISAEFRASPLGPRRKYYSITEDGQNFLEKFILCWEDTQRSVNSVLSWKKDG